MNKKFEAAILKKEPNIDDIIKGLDIFIDEMIENKYPQLYRKEIQLDFINCSVVINFWISWCINDRNGNAEDLSIETISAYYQYEYSEIFMTLSEINAIEENFNI